MIKGFQEFLLKNNVIALAVGIIIGGAVGKMVTSMVNDILMPIISLAMPSGDWKTARIILSRAVGPDGKEVINAINVGTFVGTVIDFAIIAFCVYVLVKGLLKQELPA